MTATLTAPADTATSDTATGTGLSFAADTDTPGDGTAGDDTTRGGLQFLSRTIRVRGYARVGLGPVAAGTHDGVPVRLIVPIERIVVAEARVRIGGTRLTTAVTAPTQIEAACVAALNAAAQACGVDAGELTVHVQMPPARSSGTDQVEAAALAVIDAIARATETPLSAGRRAELVAVGLGRPGSGLAAGGPALVDAHGRVRAVAYPPRTPLIVVQPTGGGTDAADVQLGQGGGELTALPDGELDERTFCDWLARSAAAPAGPVTDAIRSWLADCGVDADVVGGRCPGAPVLVLLHGDGTERVLAAQRMCVPLRQVLPDGWTISIAKSATPA